MLPLLGFLMGLTTVGVAKHTVPQSKSYLNLSYSSALVCQESIEVS